MILILPRSSQQWEANISASRTRRLPIWLGCALLLGACATTLHGENLTSVRFDRDVHFVDPQGASVLARRGIYRVTVTAAGSQLRLYPYEGRDPLTLATQVTGHEETGATLPLALTFSEGDDDLHVALLLPGTQALDAHGSYNGVGAQPENSSPQRYSARYRQARLDRAKHAAAWPNAPAFRGRQDRPSWHDLEITSNLGIETFSSQLDDHTWSAYRVSPGATISVTGLALENVQSIDSARLVVYTGARGDPRADSEEKFGRLTRVEYTLNLAFVSADRLSFRAGVDPATSGLPPGAAYLEVDYHQAGEARTIALGSQARPGEPSVTWARYHMPPLYFVPQYTVYLGSAQLTLIPGGLENGVEFIFNPLREGFAYPRHWVVRKVHLEPSPDFNGASFLKVPCASAEQPRQGYHVKIPPPESGTLQMNYELVGPRGSKPPGRESFDSFSELSDYEGARLRGFPLVSDRPAYVDRAYSLDVFVKSGCFRPTRPTR